MSITTVCAAVSNYWSILKTLLQVPVKGVSYRLQSLWRHIGRRCLLC